MTPSGVVVLGLLLLHAAQLASAQNNCTRENQRRALTSFYADAGGRSWTNSSGWNTTADVCAWFGVQCCNPAICATDPYCQNCTLGLVTGLGLAENNVRALHDGCPAASHAHVCPHACMGCIRLDAMAGSQSVHTWSHLTLSQVSGANLGGLGEAWMAEALACSLMELTLMSNLMSGPLPSGLTSLSRLETLSLSRNKLNGT